MVEPDPAVHLLVQITVTGSELVTKDVEREEVHLIGVVGIGRMPCRLRIRGVVVQDVEDVMRLMFVGADDPGVECTWFNTMV